MAKSIRERKDELKNKIRELKNNPAVASNLKFALLFRSRLMEEGIPLAHAEVILRKVRFDFPNVNEDDDYIGDIALEYAEVCKKYYDFMWSNGIRNIDVISERLDLMKLELPAE